MQEKYEKKVTQEKKTKKHFILAVPTIVIIIVFIVAMSYLIYKNNYKPLSRNEALNLAEKALSINNLYCQVTVERGTSDTESAEETTTIFRRKDNIIYIESSDCKEYLNTDTNECTYVDVEGKEAYTYESDSVLESYNDIIYGAIQYLSNSNYEYSFIKYEKVNGVKCATFTLSDESTETKIWLNNDSGVLAKLVVTYKTDDTEDSVVTYIYRYQTGSVTDEDVAIPDLSEYTVVDM